LHNYQVQEKLYDGIALQGNACCSLSLRVSEVIVRLLTGGSESSSLEISERVALCSSIADKEATRQSRRRPRSR